jgi:hypothetical protein
MEIWMKLAIWVAKEVKKRKISKTKVLKELSAQSEVSVLTLQIAERGGKMSLYAKAKQVSEATGNKVSVKELCEG